MVYEVTTHLLLPDGSEQHGGNTSGHVYTGESLHQPLGLLSSGETKLVSDSTYAVRVRVWSGTRGGPRPDVLQALSKVSSPVYFGTGLAVSSASFKTGKWEAPWLAVPTERSQLRLSFALPANKRIRQARVYAATSGYSALFLDGRRINGQPPGDELGPWTTWAVRILYRAYDVTALLNSSGSDGRHILGAWVGRGQFGGQFEAGRAGWWPNRDSKGAVLAAELPRPCSGCAAARCLDAVPARCPPVGIRLQVNVLFEDGGRAVVKNISQWSASAGPITWADVYDGESFDNRLFDRNWTVPVATADGGKKVKFTGLTQNSQVDPAV
jgi:hypothetical protein